MTVPAVLVILRDVEGDRLALAHPSCGGHLPTQLIAADRIGSVLLEEGAGAEQACVACFETLTDPPNPRMLEGADGS